MQKLIIENGDDPKAFAKVVLRIVEAKSPRFRYHAGSDTMFAYLKRLLPFEVVAFMLRKKFLSSPSAPS